MSQKQIPKKPSSLPPEVAELVYEYAYDEQVDGPGFRIVLRGLRTHDELIRDHQHADEIRHLTEDTWRKDFERRFQELVGDVRELERGEEVTGVATREQLVTDYRRIREENELLKTKARERWQNFGMTILSALVVAFLLWLAGVLKKL